MKRPANLASTISIDNAEGIATIPLKRRKLVANSTWMVDDPPELPYLYLKEKTSVVVFNDSPQLIANRIVGAAKGMNIVGKYQDAEAKATLKKNDTEFCIQLFKVTEKSNECIIVELHRKDGSAIVFHNIARSILSASKNVSASRTKTSQNKTNRTYRGHEGWRDTTQRSQAQERELFPRTMEIVSGLLSKDRIDAKVLGMESLQLLTSTQSSSDAMVSFASNVVLCGGDFGYVREAISSFIAERFSDPENDIEQKYHDKLRVYSFLVLSNALEAVSSIGVSVEHDWIDDGLLTQLLNELKFADTSPHEAHLAGKCLVSALGKSVTLRENAAKMGASKIVLQIQGIERDAQHLIDNVSTSLLQLLETE